jgi:hypothetical protein
MENSVAGSIIKQNTAAVYDTGGRVKTWGRRGILGGSLIGFALGVALVALSHTGNVLTFGVFGTLIVGVVEGAVIAGTFAACAAALYGKGVLRGSAAMLCRTPSARRPPAEAGRRERDLPLSDLPSKRSQPSSAAVQPSLEVTEDANLAPPSLQSVQTWLTTLDAWETGRTGP